MDKFFIYDFKHFLGSRDYIHSSQQFEGLINAIAKWNANGCNIGRIHNVFSSYLLSLTEIGKYVLFQDALSFKQNSNKFSTTYKIIDDNQKTFFVGVLGTGERVLKQVEYSEEKLIDKYTRKKQGSVFWGNFPKALIVNLIIAINKKIHNEYFQHKAHWMLARLDLWWKIIESEPVLKIDLKISKNIGDKMTKANIIINDSDVGDVYFMKRKS